jgi:transcriptional regulator with XRE-family HTH domain
MADTDDITGAQVRMARAFLRWSVADLAKKAKVGISTVQRIEAVDGTPTLGDDLPWRAEAREKVIASIRETLLRSGITFLPDEGRGIGIRGKPGRKRA